MKKISYERIGEYLQTALSILDENEGSFPARDLFPILEKRLNLSEYELARYEKSGYVRWQAVVQFYSIDVAKAGWLKKSKGVWYLTDEGKQSLKMSPEAFILEASRKFKEWNQQREVAKPIEEKADDEVIIEESSTTKYNQAQENARVEIEEHIRNLNPYEFQDLVAALLRGMGYYTPFVAPQGPDNGIDIIAYRDPLGAEGARIKVQVKHRWETKVGTPEIAQLNGILREKEVGLVCSSGGFTRDAVREMRQSNNHIEKIDLDDLISLWEEYYMKLDEEDKSLLPLRKIAFLAPKE